MSDKELNVCKMHLSALCRSAVATLILLRHKTDKNTALKFHAIIIFCLAVLLTIFDT